MLFHISCQDITNSSSSQFFKLFIRKLVKEHGSNLRHEELLSLTANYPEVERVLIKGMQEGELQYKQLSSTQRDIKSLACIYVTQ